MLFFMSEEQTHSKQAKELKDQKFNAKQVAWKARQWEEQEKAKKQKLERELRRPQETNELNFLTETELDKLIEKATNIVSQTKGKPSEALEKMKTANIPEAT